MHHIFLWLWNQPSYAQTFLPEHVNVVAAQIRRLTPPDVRVVCITDQPRLMSCETAPLWEDLSKVPNVSGAHLPSCYRRLKLFDPETQRSLGVKEGDRVVSMDLDVVLLKDLTKLLNRKGRFVGWRVPGTVHKHVYNGSMFMFTAGDLSELWEDFDPQRSPTEYNKAGYMGSDQGWISYKVSKLGDVGFWESPEMMSYPREIRRTRTLRADTTAIFFPGRRKPWDLGVQRESPWVSRYWRL